MRALGKLEFCFFSQILLPLTLATPLKAISPSTTEKSGFVRNSSVRLSDTRARRSMRATKPLPTLATFNEIPSGAGNRSSGLGSEDSFSETATPGAAIHSVDGRISSLVWIRNFLAPVF